MRTHKRFVLFELLRALVPRADAAWARGKGDYLDYRATIFTN